MAHEMTSSSKTNLEATELLVQRKLPNKSEYFQFDCPCVKNMEKTLEAL